MSEGLTVPPNRAYASPDRRVRRASEGWRLARRKGRRPPEGASEMNGFRRLIVFASALALVLSGLLSTSAALASGWTISTVVSGLKLPRGIAFDGRGGMYVAESGLAGSGPFGMTQGAVD